MPSMPGVMAITSRWSRAAAVPLSASRSDERARSGELDGQATHALPRQLEDRTRDRGRDRGHARLAHARDGRARLDDGDVDLGRLIHAQNLVRVEVALHGAPV